MKRIGALALLLALLFALPVSARAESSRLRIEEMGLSVELPEGLLVFTRDTSEADPGLARLGLSRNELLNGFRQSNIYLKAVAPDEDYEIVLTMLASPLGDFGGFSDPSLRTLLDSLKGEYEKIGFSVTAAEIYHHPQTKFGVFTLSREENGKIVHSLQYTTVNRGKALSFTLHAYSAQVDQAMAERLKQMVESAVFDEAALEPAEGESTEAFLYTDAETGAVFTVPAEWMEQPLNGERQYLDVLFVSGRDPSVSILYGSTDLWSQLPESERGGITREEMGEALFPAEVLAAAFGADPGEVRRQSFGGEEYTLLPMGIPAAQPGAEISMTAAFRVENGVLYLYQFAGDQEHPLYPDFLALLESARYPHAGTGEEKGENSPAPRDSVGSPPPSGEENEGRLPEQREGFSGKAVLVLLAALLICLGPAAVFRYGVRRKALSGRTALVVAMAYGLVLALAALLLPGEGTAAACCGILAGSAANFLMLRSPKAEKTGEQRTQPQ